MKTYINANLTWLLPATLAVSMFWVVSACANYYAGGTLGTDARILSMTTSELFSYASLSSDVLKTVMLFALTAAMFSRQWKVALVTGLIWVTCTGWSIGSATRFVVQNNSDVVDNRGKSADEWSLLKDQIARLQERREKIDAVRSKGVVQAEIDSLLRTPGAGDCSTINGPVTARICPQVDQLRVELGHAESALWIDGRLEELRQDLKATERVSSENPFADIVGGLFGVKPEEITTQQALYFAFLLELISGLGLWCVWMAFIGASQKKATEARTEPEASPAPTPQEGPGKPDSGVSELRKVHSRMKVMDAASLPDSPPKIRKDPHRSLAFSKDHAPAAVESNYPEIPDSSPKPQPTIVEFPSSLKEEREDELSKVIGRFVKERLDLKSPDAKLVKTGKGYWREGGTKSTEVQRAYNEWADENDAPPVEDGRVFGKLMKARVTSARNGTKTFYGCTLRPVEEKQRRVA